MISSAIASSASIASVGTAVTKLNQLEADLNDRFLERSEIIRGLLLALLIRQGDRSLFSAMRILFQADAAAP